MKDIFTKGIIKALKYLFLTIYLFLSLYPLLWMLFYSFKNNSEILVTNPFGFPRVFRIQNYMKALTEYDLPSYFKNSIIVAVFAVLFTITLSMMFSYATARMTWRFSTSARLYLATGMFIPVQVILIPLVIIVRDLKLSNTLISLIIPYVAFELAFSSIIFYGFFRTIPFEMEESAAIDGASIYTAFFKIILPLVKPVIATLVIFVFLAAWNEFTIALVLIYDNSLKTLPLGLLAFRGKFSTDWGATGAALTIASLPTVIVYLAFSDHVEKALTVGAALKG